MARSKLNQFEKARLGAIGENNVVSMLMQKGWDAFNANCSVKNYKAVDVICINSSISESIDEPWKPKTVFVQVKTSVCNNIPIGFTIGQCYSREYLEEYVKGPYVFVVTEKGNNEFKFRYFILSRSQFINLVHESHKFYYDGYKRLATLKDGNVAGLYVRWLKGESDKATQKHIAFDNPLKGISCENAWDNIWKP